MRFTVKTRMHTFIRVCGLLATAHPNQIANTHNSAPTCCWLSVSHPHDAHLTLTSVSMCGTPCWYAHAQPTHTAAPSTNPKRTPFTCPVHRSLMVRCGGACVVGCFLCVVGVPVLSATHVPVPRPTLAYSFSSPPDASIVEGITHWSATRYQMRGGAVRVAQTDGKQNKHTRHHTSPSVIDARDK